LTGIGLVQRGHGSGQFAVRGHQHARLDPEGLSELGSSPWVSSAAAFLQARHRVLAHTGAAGEIGLGPCTPLTHAAEVREVHTPNRTYSDATWVPSSDMLPRHGLHLSSLDDGLTAPGHHLPVAFTDYVQRSFTTWVWPLLGLIFLPWTTLLYIL